MAISIKEICSSAPVIPVIEIENADRAVPLAQALIRGGIHVIEITLRTPQALDAIRAVSKIEGLHVGAGTLLNVEDVANAKNAGATFGVSPGSTPQLIEACQKEQLPLLPGAVFCPTGGVSVMNAENYLSLPNVICVGGSWIASKQLIANQEWKIIEENAKAASILK